MMGGVQAPDGWTIDADTLQPVVLDRARLERRLAEALPLERLDYLGLLGRADAGLAEAMSLLADEPADPWPLLLRIGQLQLLAGDRDQSELFQTRAYRYARSRSRQATTLHQLGRIRFLAGDLIAAAVRFQLALTQRRGFAEPATVAESEQALQAVRRRFAVDAIVLAGGAGVRLGGQRLGAKALIPLAGWPLADHVLLAASAARQRIQVGPARVALADPVFRHEQPAGGGPVAAIAAALDDVTAPLVAVLAADLPFIADALPGLARAAAERDAAALVDTGGRTCYLAAVWRAEALRAAVRTAGPVAGAPVRRLYDSADVELVPDFDACSADVDTPAELAAAEARIRAHQPGQLPASPLAWPRLELHAPS